MSEHTGIGWNNCLCPFLRSLLRGFFVDSRRAERAVCEIHQERKCIATAIKKAPWGTLIGHVMVVMPCLRSDLCPSIPLNILQGSILMQLDLVADIASDTRGVWARNIPCCQDRTGLYLNRAFNIAANPAAIIGKNLQLA